MEIFSGYKEIKKLKGDNTIAIGNFDGLHLGHQKILDIAKDEGKGKNFGILTFNPHPREFFDKSFKNFRLMSRKFKIKILKELGLSFYVELPFDEKLSKLSPQMFCETILKKNLKAKNIIVGEDFRFGNKRNGDINDLINFGNIYNFKVTTSKTVSISNTEISSTLIRKLLTEGNVSKINDFLGRWHSYDGKVIHGDKRGRKLGFPTVNLNFDNLYIPKFGIYSSLIEILTGSKKGIHKAVVSVGERPTFGKNTPNFEAHLFNFNTNIYGEEIIAKLTHFQRPELKFNTVEDLILQMKKDCEIAKKNLDLLDG
tara:strand:+ start:2576 stop:3514 length:939 start_codon:yes stop_codon:yes gene_type:complete